jgi:hypothetical protein
LSIAVLSLAAHVEVKCLGDSVDSGANLRWKGRCSDPRARRLFMRRLNDFEKDRMVDMIFNTVTIGIKLGSI